MLERGGIMNGGGEGENEPTDAPVGRYGQYTQGGSGSWVNSHLRSKWLRKGHKFFLHSTYNAI